MRVARCLDIPIIATAEDVELDGPLVPELAELLPADSPPIFNKMVFGLYGQPIPKSRLMPVAASILCWSVWRPMCVSRSRPWGYAPRGYRVSAVEDACGSPPP